MTEAFELNANSRTQTGKAVSRRMRRLEKTIPAVIYGAGKDSQAISLLHKDIHHVLSNEASYSRVLKVNIDGQSQQVVLKAIQRHPYKPRILHVDFLRIKAKEKITMNVPLHFIGEDTCPGAKAGGVISKLMTELEIKCLPANLPEFIEVDITNLEMDASLHISDIQLPSGVELGIAELDEEHNLPVISIHPPRVEKEPVAEEAAEEEKAEGEEGKEEGETKE